MKTIQKEIIRKEYENIYVANDGTEFRNEEECRKYDESAKGVLMARYTPKVLRKVTEENLFGIGSCDNVVEIVKIETREDADLVFRVLLLVNPHLNNGEYDKWAQRDRNLIEKALENKECVFIGRGFQNDCFWVMGTPTTIAESLKDFCKPEEKKD